MFYGYESEAQMRQHNPKIADQLIHIAEKQTKRVCTRGKNCTGSIDGKEFIYSDGSKDTGVEITSCRAKLGDSVFQWPL